ncbi:hypothetical protein BURKHO8Y_360005 [Burkholderia sp. 8Y]|nr:hypothetical protein BURKHO8Y_360005 [Burkholderia sp. 8Y]
MPGTCHMSRPNSAPNCSKDIASACGKSTTSRRFSFRPWTTSTRRSARRPRAAKHIKQDAGISIILTPPPAQLAPQSSSQLTLTLVSKEKTWIVVESPYRLQYYQPWLQTALRMRNRNVYR